VSRDLYEVLGVSRSASNDEIKRAYRSLARQHHPDANRDDPNAEERFKEATRAYEILRDPERRRRYEQFGDDGTGGRSARAGDFGGGISDLFDAFFGGDPFGGRGGRGPAGPGRGVDAELAIELTLEEAAFGVTRTLEIRLPVECERCDGSGCERGTHPTRCDACGGSGEIREVRRTILGQMVTAAPCFTCGATGSRVLSPCRDCGGEGSVEAPRSVDIEVPSGVDDGQRLRLSGRGPAGPRGGVPGDLYVGIRVAPHAELERHGDDLLCTRSVAFTQAALGARIEIATLEGPDELVMPPGTQAGHRFRLKGRGVPSLRGRARGDLVVQVDVAVPTRLSSEEAELLARLAELRGEAVEPAEPGLLSRLRSAFQ